MTDDIRPDAPPATEDDAAAEPSQPARGRFSRRRVLGVTGAGVAGAAVGMASGIGVARAASVPAPAAAGPQVYPFYGEHQA
ncbi:MAG: hypothetical protein ACRYG2_30670, partial [Janthinobacterium lividum]